MPTTIKKYKVFFDPYTHDEIHLDFSVRDNKSYIVQAGIDESRYLIPEEIDYWKRYYIHLVLPSIKEFKNGTNFLPRRKKA